MNDTNIWLQDNQPRIWIVGDEDVIRVQTLTKDYEESLQFAFDFSEKEEIQSGDSIASVTSLTATPTGLTLADEDIDEIAHQVRVTISGGTSSTRYVLRCKILTTNGYTIIGKGNLTVE